MFQHVVSNATNSVDQKLRQRRENTLRDRSSSTEQAAIATERCCTHLGQSDRERSIPRNVVHDSLQPVDRPVEAIDVSSSTDVSTSASDAAPTSLG
eukprot:767851-Hanusia_phi.AAC.4